MPAHHSIAFKALAVTGALVAGTAAANPCDAYITQEMNWVRDAPAGVERSINANIISLDGGAKASYTIATLDKYSPESCLWLNGLCYRMPASLATTASESQYFNQNCVKAPDSFLCLNPFSNGSYTAKVRLTSTTLTIDPDRVGDANITLGGLTCQNNVMYGFSGGATPGMYVVNLSRSEFVAPK